MSENTRPENVFYDTLIGEWFAKIEIGDFELDVLVRNGALKIISFRDDGSYFFTDFSDLNGKVLKAEADLKSLGDDDFGEQCS